MVHHCTKNITIDSYFKKGIASDRNTVSRRHFFLLLLSLLLFLTRIKV